jgi:hypothetical protein
VPQPRTRQPPEGVPPEYVAAAAGILGAQAAGEPPEPPDDSAQLALIAAVLVWVDRYLLEARRRRRAALEARLRAISRDEAEREAILDYEEILDAEYASKQKERIRERLRVIAAIPDPAERARQVRMLMANERRIDRSHTEMAIARPAAALAHIELRKVSPTGALWRLGQRENHCAICLFMANRFWPWEVLEEVSPPVHFLCGCSLHGLGEAIASGALDPASVPTKAEALRLARGIVLDEEAYEEIWLDESGALGLLVEVFASWKGWDPNLHPRDNLGRFVETLAELTPKGMGKNWGVALDPKIRVSRDPDGTYRVTANSRIHKGFRNHVDAAVFAFDRSAKSETPGSVGDSFPGQEGVPKYKDFDSFLKVKGYDPTDAWIANKGASGVDGVASKAELDDEVSRLLGEALAAKESPDKYVQRTAAPLSKRAKALTVKRKNAPEIPANALPPVVPPSASKAQSHQDWLEGLAPGTYTAWSKTGVEIHVTPGPEGVSIDGEDTISYDEAAEFLQAKGAVGVGQKVEWIGPGNTKISGEVMGKAEVGGAKDHVKVEVESAEPESAIAQPGSMMTPAISVLANDDGPKPAADPEMVKALSTAAIQAQLEEMGPVSAKVFTTDAGNVVVVRNGQEKFIMNMEGGGEPGAPTSDPATMAKALSAMNAKPVEGPTPIPKVAIETGLKGMGIGDVVRWDTAGDGSSFVVWRKSADEFSVKAWSPVLKEFVPGAQSSKQTLLATSALLHDAKAVGSVEKVNKTTGLPVEVTKPPPAPPKPPQPDDAWENYASEYVLATKLTDLHGETLAKANATEKAALKAYTGHQSGEINAQLRHPRGLGKEAIEKKIVALDSLFDKAAPFKEDAVIWRGVGGKTKEEYKAAEPGDIIRDNGFGSTSTKESFARGWSNLVLKIHWPKGAKALWAKPGSAHSSEDEVLLPRGVAMKVLGKRVEGANYTIIVEPISGHKG